MASAKSLSPDSTSMDAPAWSTRRWANATGGVGLLGIVTISLFYTVGGIFGPLNDLCNAAMALLSVGLAWRLRPGPGARFGRWLVGVAGLGAAIAVWGSVLVVSRRTGWYLAGLYSTLGFGFIGLWLGQLNTAAAAWPRGLARFGRLTGAAMALGLLAVPGIARGIDAPATAPWWAHAGYLGGLGWFVLYPIWCLWLGRALAGARAAVAAD